VTSRHATQVIASRKLAPAWLVNVGAVAPESADANVSLKETTDALRLLVDDPDVGDEARLRVAVLSFLIGQPSAAEQFRSTVSSRDPFVAYLSHMMLGIVSDDEGRLDDARRHYDAAIQIVPARSATIGVSATLFLLGQPDEAAQQFDRSNTGAPSRDPWKLYGLRDYRLVPDYLIRLRRLVAR
jgi:Tfp pilus assembly protein PilF